jgi:hypothetical protein
VTTRRKRRTLWLLLLSQVVPFLVVAVDEFDVVGDFGLFAEQYLQPHDWPAFVFQSLRFLFGYWFFILMALMAAGGLAAICMVIFDAKLSPLRRLAWSLSFLLAMPVTVTLFCVLELLPKESAPAFSRDTTSR